MAKSREEACESCAAFIRIDSEGGECHKGHPVAVADGVMRNKGEIQACWPFVENQDWCYGFIPSKNQEED